MTSTGKRKKRDTQIELSQRDGTWHGRFSAMASPCEVLIDARAPAIDEAAANRLVARVVQEAWRIERKFSRYRSDGIVHSINSSNGKPVKVDSETARLLAYAEQCWRLSEGRFDITSGVLRRVWHFDGSDNIPSDEAVAEIQPLIGWEKVNWDGRKIGLKAGMEVDLGGIGKEYAVDRAFDIVTEVTALPLLVNFGGDLRCSGARADGSPWRVGIETVEDPNAPRLIELYAGALATSGDARRFLLKNGVRYSHVLDPRNGRPVQGAPRSVTVAGDSCTEAGLIATLALLQGPGAEDFLKGNEVRYWVQS